MKLVRRVQERKAKLPSVKIVHSVLMKITGSYLILYSFQLKLADTKSRNMKSFMYIVFNYMSWYRAVCLNIDAYYCSYVGFFYLYVLASIQAQTGKVCIYRERC